MTDHFTVAGGCIILYVNIPGQSHMHGNTVVRPLFNLFPKDLNTRTIGDQFMWGVGVMVAPVLTAGAVSRSVYVPEVSCVNTKQFPRTVMYEI